MQQISLKVLLEAGCHFGHKVERWHPKAGVFIYGEKEGVHIIDLAKTKSSLEAAATYVQNLARDGKKILFVGTKRQARGVVTQAAKKGSIFYLTNRWVGGFLTNFEEVKKNIDKLNRMRKESTDGTWNQFPKHERVQLEKEMRKLAMVYDGVAALNVLPDAIYIVDIKKESSAVKEAKRKGIPIIAIVDTNSNPTLVDYYIPANDDAVGSIELITNYLVDAYMDGRGVWEKKERVAEGKEKNVSPQQSSGEAVENVPVQQLKKEDVKEKKLKVIKAVKPKDEILKADEKKEESTEKPKKKGRLKRKA